MTAAIFGLAGVAVGGFLTSLGTYLGDRRKSWLEARAAGLLVFVALQDAQRSVDKAGSEVLDTDSPIRLAVKSWNANRANLLFRRGNFPSGLTAAQWLRLAALFDALDELPTGLIGNRASFDPFQPGRLKEPELSQAKLAIDTADKAKRALRDALTILQVFHRDDSALKVFIVNSGKRIFGGLVSIIGGRSDS